MKQIRVTVTEKHIKDGARSSTISCPIALALQEQYDTLDVRVTGWSAGVDGALYSLSNKAEDFIHKFDTKEKVGPATFVFKRNFVR